MNSQLAKNLWRKIVSKTQFQMTQDHFLLIVIGALMQNLLTALFVNSARSKKAVIAKDEKDKTKAHVYFCVFVQWDDQYIYLIMEYCSGGDLSRFIHSKRTLPEQVVKRFLQQLGTC